MNMKLRGYRAALIQELVTEFGDEIIVVDSPTGGKGIYAEAMNPRHTWRIGEKVHVEAVGFDVSKLYVIVGIVKHFLVVAEKMVPTRMGRKVAIAQVRHLTRSPHIIYDEVSYD